MEFKKIYAVVCLFIVFGCNRAAKSQQNNGAEMPDFKFYRLQDSAAFQKADVEKGKKSIMILFDTSCSHCQNQMDSISQHYDQFKAINFYLVSFDDKKEIVKFMRKYGSNLDGKDNVTVLQDSGHDFIPKFQPTKYPAMYVYSEKRSLIKYLAGEAKIKDLIELTK